MGHCVLRLGSRLDEAVGDPVTLDSLALPVRAVVARVQAPDVSIRRQRGHDVQDLVSIAGEAGCVELIVEGLGVVGEGLVGLDEDELVDDRVELVQPDLEHVQLVEEDERIEQPVCVRSSPQM
eukprot:1747587-Rhodomonas_salina.1